MMILYQNQIQQHLYDHNGGQQLQQHRLDSDYILSETLRYLHSGYVLCSAANTALHNSVLSFTMWTIP